MTFSKHLLWLIEQFDEDPAILYRLNRVGDLNRLAGYGFSVRVGAIGGKIHGAFGSLRCFIGIR
jgi:hypothetical protein